MSPARGAKAIVRHAPVGLLGGALVSLWVSGRYDLASRGGLTSTLGVVLGTMGAWVAVLLPGLACHATLVSRHPTGPGRAWATILAGSGVAGALSFWAWFLHPAIGFSLSLGLLGASIALLTRRPAQRAPLSPEVAFPLITGAVLVVALTSVGYVRGGVPLGAGGVAQRYWAQIDNAIPKLFADRLASRAPLRPLLFGDWQSSDRPPLQAGMALLVRPVSGAGEPAYQYLGTAVQALWIPALWALLRILHLSHRRILTVVLLTATTGAVFLNTVYTWPKMLAASFTLAALAVLLESATAPHSAMATLCGACLGLSLLAHGAAAFGALGLGPAVWRVRHRMSPSNAIAAGAALILLLGPWMAYQRLYDPPGDRLLKWHLAGVPQPDERPLLEAFSDQYRALGPAGLVSHKAHNVAALIATPDLWNHWPAATRWSRSLGGQLRAAQASSLLFAPGVLLVGLWPLLRRRRSPGDHPLAELGRFVAVSTCSWALLMFGGQSSRTIIHQGPLALLVIVVAMCALGATQLGVRRRVLTYSGSAATFVVLWVLVDGRSALSGPQTPSALEPSMIASVSLSVAGLALVGRALRREEHMKGTSLDGFS
jgi:hypothetical protein